MKHLLFILFFLPLAGSAQTPNGTPDSPEQVHIALIDSLESQRLKIALLLEKLEAIKRQSAAEIAALQKENETLRQIMIGYVKSIDQLNTDNLKLEEELNACGQ